MTRAGAPSKQAFVRELLGRSDYAIIGEIVEPGTKVLDLGCGEGELLAWLAENKGVEARGVEISRRQSAARHRPRRLGLPGRYRRRAGRLSRPGLRLRDPQPDAAGDAPPAPGAARDAARGTARDRGVPQFRPLARAASMLISGRAPRTKLFPYEWYDSPNIHFLTVQDFEELAALEGLVVERRYFLSGQRKVTVLPNLRAEVAVYLVRR